MKIGCKALLAASASSFGQLGAFWEVPSSKKLLVAPGISTRNKKLLVTRASLLVARGVYDLFTFRVGKNEFEASRAAKFAETPTCHQRIFWDHVRVVLGLERPRSRNFDQLEKNTKVFNPQLEGRIIDAISSTPMD